MSNNKIKTLVWKKNLVKGHHGFLIGTKSSTGTFNNRSNQVSLLLTIQLSQVKKNRQTFIDIPDRSYDKIRPVVVAILDS